MLAVRSGAHMGLVQRIVSSSMKVAASQALPAGSPSHFIRVHLQTPFLLASFAHNSTGRFKCCSA